MTAVNRAFCEALGLPESAIVGKHYRQLGFPEALAQEWDELLRRAAEGELVRGETTAVFPSGEVRTYDVMLTPVHGDEGVVRIRGVSRNVTERRRLEVQLRQAQKMEAIGRLAGGLAHDFNNIMTVIQAYAHFLRAKVRTDEPLREDIDEICKAAERAEHLTRQLLAFSRKSMVELRQLNLNHLVLDMKNMLGRILGEEVDLEVSDAPSLWPVRADLGQMEQVLTNLVVNARDAMPRGGKLTIETANVDIAGETDSARSDGSPGQYVVLRVTDTGEGMPPEVQERVFEPFFTTKKPGRGTGLGLATVYGIVKQAGGFITLDSEVGKGTRIQVHLPRLRGPSARQSSSPSKPPDALLGGGRVVLLVEDEPALRRAVCRMLEQLGFEVVEAGNGREALEKVRQATKPFDLILTDVVMPVMNGKELIDEVHAIHPKLPVVYMSGYTEDAIVEHGVLAPDTVFLAKPFSVDELVAKLRQVLSARAER